VFGRVSFYIRAAHVTHTWQAESLQEIEFMTSGLMAIGSCERFNEMYEALRSPFCDVSATFLVASPSLCMISLVVAACVLLPRLWVRDCPHSQSESPGKDPFERRGYCFGEAFAPHSKFPSKFV
jgi:hypothetical protein